MAGLIALAGVSLPRQGECAPPYATRADEFTLLAYANMSRAANHLTPLVWNDGLGQAARWKSDDEIAHSCNSHDSCNGEAWWRRIQRYYPGWFALGENIAGSVGIPRRTHDNWMGSSIHRANILGPYSEFGAGVSVGGAATGNREFSTEDFGDRGGISPASIPTLPAAGVSPRRGWKNSTRELVLNYFDLGGAPRAVRALIGSSCVTLPRISGSASNGTYGINRAFSDPCTPIVFEAIRSDGSRHRWPERGAVQVAVDYAVCDEFTANAPTQDCGGGGGPVPTPTPTPPGETGALLDSVRVALKPDRVGTSTGRVRIEATLPALASFDPTSGPIEIHASFGESAEWSQSLPQTCGSGPCLKVNRRGTVYNAAYDADTKLTFARTQDGRWKMRFSSRRQTLEGLAPGAVTLSLTVGDRTFIGSAYGDLRERGLVAD